MTTPSEPITSSCAWVASVDMFIAARVRRAAAHAVGTAQPTPINTGMVAERPGNSCAATAPSKPNAPMKPATLWQRDAASDPDEPEVSAMADMPMYGHVQVSEMDVCAEADRRRQQEQTAAADDEERDGHVHGSRLLGCPVSTGDADRSRLTHLATIDVPAARDLHDSRRGREVRATLDGETHREPQTIDSPSFPPSWRSDSYSRLIRSRSCGQTRLSASIQLTVGSTSITGSSPCSDGCASAGWRCADDITFGKRSLLAPNLLPPVRDQRTLTRFERLDQEGPAQALSKSRIADENGPRMVCQ